MAVFNVDAVLECEGLANLPCAVAAHIDDL